MDSSNRSGVSGLSDLGKKSVAMSAAPKSVGTPSELDE